MESKAQIREKIRFCSQYLMKHGIDNGSKFDIILKEPLSGDRSYKILECYSEKDLENFIHSAATALHNLWPSGEKDGKYPWKGSVKATADRLKILWNDRHYDTLESKYSVSDVVSVATKYLSNYQNDATYMSTLPYFIMKQKDIVQSDGKRKYYTTSILGDMLESISVSADVSDYNAHDTADSTFEEGILI